MRIAIIGAGLSGLSCATALVDTGHETILFDKGRGPGGRMSTRRLGTRLGEVAFDHGAQYFTAREPSFVAQVERWRVNGHVARWAPAGDDAWVGTPAMNAPVRDLSSRLDVRWGHRVDSISNTGDGWHVHSERLDLGLYDMVILAVPAEQVAPLIERHRPDWADQARSTRSHPCWTVMATYGSRLPIESDRLTDMGAIASAVRNSAKPGRPDGEAWVLQASAEWSAEHLEEAAETVEQEILRTFSTSVAQGLPVPIATSAHRWRYAKSGRLGQDLLWDGSRRLGVCGDWLLGARVEAAWLSGRRLAQAIIDA